MTIEIKIPAVGESITEVQVGQWHHHEGDVVKRETPLVTIETDKVSVDVTAPVDGRISRILLTKGVEAKVGDIVCLLDETATAAVPVTTSSSAVTTAPEQTVAKIPAVERVSSAVSVESSLNAPSTSAEFRLSSVPFVATPAATEAVKVVESTLNNPSPWASPSARRALAEHGLRPDDVRDGVLSNRIVREDVERHVQTSPKKTASTVVESDSGEFEEQIVPMSPLRKRVAARLVEAQQQAALLTTFNEVDMSSVQQLRAEEKARFEEKHGVKLGLMSFFVRAVVEALKAVPVVNAEVRGTDIVYKNHYDIGIAVGSGRGLVVPILRNAERMGFSAVEKAIVDFGTRAKANRLELHELQGGTFTISNGGVYGSMLSTPIVNPPQSAILGLHAITDRPVARNGQVVIRPMMFVALTYDHRIIDGREAVTFLRKVKDGIEQPVRLLLEV
jgi:2-oxoglutarate dehydrogenase E2 component (dihydrolipoamide succinyltransferase)